MSGKGWLALCQGKLISHELDRGVGGGGDNVRRMRATEKRARLSHSQQILAPTFQLLGNLQICSAGHLGKVRLGERRVQAG